MYYFGGTWCLLAVVTAAAGERWRWPGAGEAGAGSVREGRGEASVRIDTKVRFVDEDGKHDKRKNGPLSDEVPTAPFKEPTDTEGFYNRPPGAGRYPVHVSTQRANYRVGSQVYPVTTYKPPQNDGTLDSLQYCKCVSTPDCSPRPDPGHVCGSGQFLCCFKKPNKNAAQNPEYFNEIEDERPMLLPGQSGNPGYFHSPLGTDYDGVFTQGQDEAVFGPVSGHNGPHINKPDVLIGPEGPTGQIGPANKNVLIGPNGPTGNIGPTQRPVLVGPDGPTGLIGPTPFSGQYNNGPRDVGQSASAQRGVLVGPGGPTGIIGPQSARPVLVGPGGPTGIIGPGGGFHRGQMHFYGQGYRQQRNRGLLVGPGGPTGTIGPARGVLVGPGGPTGHIGPRYFGN